MRTLKKTLCLVLALALCFSLASVAFADYSDYTDADQVGAAYEEAVAVLIGTGIVNGMTDTTIAPTETFTREQAAKIVAYMTLGETVAKALTTTTSSFSDVDADHWSAPFIEYCVAQGYVKGYGTGKFGPTDELTGLQFAAMLLRVLGYGTNGEYEGSSWAINVAKDALNSSVGIFTGDTSAATNDPAQRQQAMLMAFNALNYTPNGSTTEYVVTASNGTTVLYKGTDAVTALLMQQANGGSTLAVQTTNAGSLGNTVYGLQKGTSSDDFGRTSKVYTNGQTGTAEVTYASFEPTAALTYTEATTYGAIVKALGYKKATDTVNFNVYTNSSTSTSANGKTIADTTAADTVGDQGTLVEVYATSTANTYDLVIVDTYVDTLTSADIVAANETAGTPAVIKLADPAQGADLSFETTDFSANDVVLYTVSGTTVVSVVKAPAISGMISATGSNYVRVDGTQKKLAANNIDNVTIGTTPGYTNTNSATYTYYLDNYGNIIHAVLGTQTNASVNYVYVINAKSVGANNSNGNDLFNNSEVSAAAAQAKVIDLSTGTISVKNIGIVKDSAGAYYYADAAGAATATAVSTDNVPVFVNPGYYTYTELSDGSIVLGATASTTNVTLLKDTATVATGVYANASTKVNVITYTANYASTSLTTYTGIANFPATSQAETALVVQANNMASSIIVVKAANVTTPVNYAIYKGTGENSQASGQAYEFYVDGEVVSYYLAGSETVTANAGDVVNLTLTNGKISADVTAETAKIPSLTVTVVEDTYLVGTSGGNTYVVYFASTGYTVRNSAQGANYATSTVAVGDVIAVYGSTALNGTTLTGADLIIK
jgi:hypothetical protein